MLQIKPKILDVSYKAAFNLGPAHFFHLIYFQVLFTLHSPAMPKVSYYREQVMPSLHSELS